MRRLTICSALIVLLAGILAGCGRRVLTGRGEVVQEARIAAAFDKVVISAPLSADIQIAPGATSSIELTGHKNLLEQIETTVSGGTLKISLKDAITLDNDNELKAQIRVANLSQLKLKGVADAVVKGPISGSGFDLDISGAGDAEIEQVQVNKLTATISGAGDVTIDQGRCEQAEFTVSGAGNINTFGVQGSHVRAKVSGAGDVEVYALKSLDARVSGAGTIRYKGKPQVSSKTSGIGEIVAAN